MSRNPERSRWQGEAELGIQGRLGEPRRVYSEHESRWIQHNHEYGCGRMGGALYISMSWNEWLLALPALMSVLRVVEQMKQVGQSCIGAGIGSSEPEVELRK